MTDARWKLIRWHDNHCQGNERAYVNCEFEPCRSSRVVLAAASRAEGTEAKALGRSSEALDELRHRCGGTLVDKMVEVAPDPASSWIATVPGAYCTQCGETVLPAAAARLVERALASRAKGTDPKAASPPTASPSADLDALRRLSEAIPGPVLDELARREIDEDYAILAEMYLRHGLALVHIAQGVRAVLASPSALPTDLRSAQGADERPRLTQEDRETIHWYFRREHVERCRGSFEDCWHWPCASTRRLLAEVEALERERDGLALTVRVRGADRAALLVVARAAHDAFYQVGGHDLTASRERALAMTEALHNPRVQALLASPSAAPADRPSPSDAEGSGSVARRDENQTPNQGDTRWHCRG